MQHAGRCGRHPVDQPEFRLDPDLPGAAGSGMAPGYRQVGQAGRATVNKDQDTLADTGERDGLPGAPATAVGHR